MYSLPLTPNVWGASHWWYLPNKQNVCLLLISRIRVSGWLFHSGSFSFSTTRLHANLISSKLTWIPVVPVLKYLRTFCHHGSVTKQPPQVLWILCLSPAWGAWSLDCSVDLVFSYLQLLQQLLPWSQVPRPASWCFGINLDVTCLWRRCLTAQLRSTQMFPTPLCLLSVEWTLASESTTPFVLAEATCHAFWDCHSSSILLFLPRILWDIC